MDDTAKYFADLIKVSRAYSNRGPRPADYPTNPLHWVEPRTSPPKNPEDGWAYFNPVTEDAWVYDSLTQTWIQFASTAGTGLTNNGSVLVMKP